MNEQPLIRKPPRGWRPSYAPKSVRAWAVCARFCLRLGCVLWKTAAVAGLVLTVAQLPAAALVLGGVGFYYFYRRPPRLGGWAHGSARLASSADLAEAGYLGDGEGLLVGRVEPPTLREAERLLRTAPAAESEAASRLFLERLAGRRGRGAWVRVNRGCHGCVISPPGGGKTQSVLLPQLRTHRGSTVNLDVKGEISRTVAEYRRRAFGQETVLLDPFRVVTDTPHTFNPLSGIDPDSPLALDEARAVAESLVVRTGEEKDPHWPDSAELMLWAMIALTVHVNRPGKVNLQTVCTLLSDPRERAAAIRVMCASRAWGGMLARLGHQLGYFVDRELGSVLTTTSRFVRFLSTPAVAESTLTTNWDPAALREGRTDVYMIVPPNFLRSHSGLLRCWVSGILRAIVRGGLQERNKILFFSR